MNRLSFLFLILSAPLALAKKKKNAFLPSTIISKGVEATETQPGTFSITAPDLNGSLTYVADPDLPHDRALMEVEFIVESLSGHAE